MATLAVGLPLDGIGGAEAIEVARRAHDWGYRACWANDSEGPDAISQVGALATTSDLELGVVVPVESRTAFMIAMTAVSLAQLSGGRFRLGIGAAAEMTPGGGAANVEHVREMVAAVRPVLEGERSSHDGQFVHLGGYRPHASPPSPVPLHVAARKRDSLLAAGALADGVCLEGVPADSLPDLLAGVQEGAEDAGRAIRVGDGRDPGFGVTVRVFCAVADGDDHDAPAGSSERLGDRSFLVGDEEQVARGVRAYADAGATVVVVQPLDRSREGLVRTLRAAASAW